MNIINKQVTLTINGATVDFKASGTKLESDEIKLTTLTRAVAGQDHLDGCTWLLGIAEVNTSIVAQIEALLL